MIEWIRFIISALLILAGIGTIAVSVFGVFRFRFVLNRMHCAAIIDTLGVMFVIAGLMVAADASVYIWKLLGIFVFLWIGSPIASHLVCRMELLTDSDALRHMEHPQDAEEEENGIL